MARRFCRDCKENISLRGSPAVRCAPCQVKHRRAVQNAAHRSPYKKVGTSAKHVIGIARQK